MKRGPPNRSSLNRASRRTLRPVSLRCSAASWRRDDARTPPPRVHATPTSSRPVGFGTDRRARVAPWLLRPWQLQLPAYPTFGESQLWLPRRVGADPQTTQRSGIVTSFESKERHSGSSRKTEATQRTSLTAGARPTGDSSQRLYMGLGRVEPPTSRLPGVRPTSRVDSF